MDILNFISWIKAGNYRATLPTDTPCLLPVAAKDSSRDDGYLSLAVNAAPLQALYNTANVTQLTSITTAVTVNANNGIITTVSSTLAAGFNTVFTVNNSKVLTTSRILITVEYSGTGLPILFTENIVNGSFDINIFNLGSAAFNNVVKVHFMIIN
jgi:chromosome condensin MukBEF complex kleisin-like MukF subunit